MTDPSQPVRILLAGYASGAEIAKAEIDAYLDLGWSVVVNKHGFSAADLRALEASYAGRSVVWIEFNPVDPGAFSQSLAGDVEGFDAIVCAPCVQALTEQTLSTLLTKKTERSLRAICCPNDSASHLASAAPVANANQIPILVTRGVHAESVAEYTLAQLVFHARRLDYFYAATGQEHAFPHSEALATTRLLKYRTLGVIGPGGDGLAVIRAAHAWGLRVIAIGSGRPEGIAALREAGAEAAGSLQELLNQSDFISINLRPPAGGQDPVIGEREISWMKRGVIIVNPAGAENIDKAALVRELSKPEGDRTVRTLILDMPYGGRRDANAFKADADNAWLKQRGVLFTPRMAGYTLEAQHAAVVQAAKLLAAHLAKA